MKKFLIKYTVEANSLADAMGHFAYPDGEERTDNVENFSIEEIHD